MLNTYTFTASWLIKTKKEWADGVKNFEKLGFRVLNRKFLAKLPSTREKVSELHRAFSDKNVDLVLARRGGYSSMKMLPLVDFGLIKRNPKLLAGFSDISTLLNTIYEKTGMVTLHSPMILNFAKPAKFSVKSFLNAINGFPEKNLFKGAPVHVYNQGNSVRGVLKGGNLITLTALIGTQWETKTDGSVLFLEDVDEKLHEVDRCLMNWIFAGKLNKIKALILGDFRNVNNREVYKVLKEQMKIKIPVVHCPYIGHAKNKITLPVGAMVELDTHKKQLKIITKGGL